MSEKREITIAKALLYNKLDAQLEDVVAEVVYLYIQEANIKKVVSRIVEVAIEETIRDQVLELLNNKEVFVSKVVNAIHEANLESEIDDEDI